MNIEIAYNCKKGYDFLQRVKDNRPIMRLTLREVEYLQDLFAWCRMCALDKIK